MSNRCNDQRKGRSVAEGITGRDNYVIGYALVHALAALEALPPERQPKTNMDDMRKMLGVVDDATVSLLLAQARCRICPDLDPAEVYRSYGIDIQPGMQPDR
ncbi:MAG TPA: hypothetical protein DEA80_16365 [Afipia sp.]|nr:hypothetical protein [Afipia sp.]OUX62461.1 MAG: hypothetical protein CBB64_04280 [Afipia sp. TMED4]HAP48451.1 hypothetical protein [Afipia sp.]HAQ93819.1 hypothetical protein [Afipia sp.]HBF53332.1 hypothetical protein [Afipia sp.]